MKRIVTVLAFYGLFHGSAEAAPRFANVFGDHAVLQRGVKLRIWGSGAEPSQMLAVRFGGHVSPTRVADNGEWESILPSLKANATGRWGSGRISAGAREGKGGE